MLNHGLLGTHMIELHLRVQVKPDCLEAFRKFLLEAIPFYEQPGGIKVRLLEDSSDPTCFIELVEYTNEEIYHQDQLRVESDPTMQHYLERWRALLERPPEVEVYRRRL